MSQLQDRIAQFRKMSTEDPDNELGHYRLGQLLMEDSQFEEAILAFERTLAIEPTFSKAFQMLGESHKKLGNTEKAIEVLTRGYAIADARGDRMPRDAMAKMLTELGAEIPKVEAPPEVDGGPETGFRCQRPGCSAGRRARKLAKPPVADAIGLQIEETICADCWNAWFKDYSIKVINELRLDLSSEFGQQEYDKYMREFLGFEDSAPQS